MEVVRDEKELVRDEKGWVLVDIEELAALAGGPGFRPNYVQKINWIAAGDAESFLLLGPQVSGRRYLPPSIYVTRGHRDGREVSIMFYMSPNAEVTKVGELFRKKNE